MFTVLLPPGDNTIAVNKYIIYLLILSNTLFHEDQRTVNTLRTRSFKLFKRVFPGFLTILTL